MKHFSKFLVLGIFVVSLFSSCAKQPTQAIDAAKAAIEAATQEGASVYAADELKKLNDDLQAAMDEVSTQSKKFLKKYGTAKEMLTKVQADGDALKATIPAKKEAAKNAAIQAQTEAKAALDEAKALLEKAPMGKGTKADIMAMKADLAGLETSFAEVQTAIDSEDYFGASAKAATIKEKATVTSDQVKAAIEKVKGKR
ncbi:MAG: hypothetical protein A2V45_11255 [Candidatus Aminicenantes bacterium RBG_19FT_COMBO_58_17]|jgi:cob(I)alamin adenosyltransferase|nr:MAG: hypothetical protein A2V45_11255 [Candidatus Aminicenantes bacterium RBG_19FT_COMBO_58_17]